jgi:hypothetical protein
MTEQQQQLPQQRPYYAAWNELIKLLCILRDSGISSITTESCLAIITEIERYILHQKTIAT